MSKFQKIAMLGFLLMLAALVYLEANKKLPISWFPSYSTYDKIPFGTYVLNELLEEEYGALLTKKNLPPYEVLNNDELKGSYVFINRTIGFDESEMDKLMQWMERGNTLFVSTTSPGYTLLDT
jgi:hypothetical protein